MPACSPEVSGGDLGQGIEKVKPTSRREDCARFSFFLGIVGKVDWVERVGYSLVPYIHVVPIVVLWGGGGGAPWVLDLSWKHNGFFFFQEGGKNIVFTSLLLV